VLAKRAEDVTERFDWAISRAVSAEDLSAFLTRLAPKYALLTGAEGPAIEGIQWEPALPLPGAEARFLRIGSCFT
jgi:hypothetical protein